jgi:hypothetical protein
MMKRRQNSVTDSRSKDKDKRTKTNIRHHDQDTNLFNRPISPRRLREGGAAILQALNKNHHIAILGIKLIKPLLIKRLRLPFGQFPGN